MKTTNKQKKPTMKITKNAFITMMHLELSITGTINK